MEVSQIVAPNTAALRDQWDELRNRNPGLRIRNAAQHLGVSELQLLLTEPESKVQRLDPAFADIYQSISLLGPVMTLARNDEVVHETTGIMGKFSVTGNGAMGICLGEIDLRVFFSHWKHGYAVTEYGAKGDRRSLQFFDAAGGALHKIYAVDKTDMSAWSALVEKYHSVDQRPAIELRPLPGIKRYQGSVDRDGLRADWQAITDVHEFHGMLQKHSLDRLTALENIGVDWAFPIASDSLETVLKSASDADVPVMIFVGNRGIVQIFTGGVSRLVNIPGWFNVLDATFNLHVFSAGVKSVWVVRRPSEDGVISSVDGFNASGELVFSVFGERKPGKPELDGWRKLVDSLRSRR